MSDQIIRKGKQLWMHDKLMADCATEGIAEVLRIAAMRSRVTRSEARLLEEMFL